MQWTPTSVILGILGLTILVVVHESGHYLAARAFGMRVLTYSIGLGQVLWKWQPKGSPTTFQICAVPFLAYVQIDGMNPMEPVDPDDDGLFANKGVMARFVTIAAGPAANYLLAAILYFAIVVTFGVRVPVGGTLHVVEVFPGTPAAEAGLESGDVIVEANGKELPSVAKLTGVTRPRVGLETDYVVRRGDETLRVTITPAPSPQDPSIGQIGVSFGYEDVRPPLGEAARLAVVWPAERTMETINALTRMVRRADSSGLGGPVKMAEIMSQAASAGPRYYLLYLALISIALGFFNLLPIPALDGGRLVFLGYELITRRRANEKVEAAVHAGGLMFLLAVLVLVTFRDIFSVGG